MVKMGYNKDLMEGKSPQTNSPKHREIVRKISQGKELDGDIEEKECDETKLEDEVAAMSIEQIENEVAQSK
jgi:hypothetical protein